MMAMCSMLVVGTLNKPTAEVNYCLLFPHKAKVKFCLFPLTYQTYKNNPDPKNDINI